MSPLHKEAKGYQFSWKRSLRAVNLIFPPSFTSNSISAMDDLHFAAKVSPARLFFRSLIVMKSMTKSPSCNFENGNIKLHTPVKDTLATLIMDSWTWFADPPHYSSPGLGVDCNSWEWMSSLPPCLSQQEDLPLYFYIKKESKRVYCLAEVGDDSSFESFEFCLGEVVTLGPDNESIDLDLRDFSLYMKSECLREVVTSVASKYDSVKMHIFEKSVAWVSESRELRYKEERNECRVEGGANASGNIYHTHVEWKGKDTLLKATEITDTVLIHAMADPRRQDWMSFKFIVDRDNHFRFAMRGLLNQMVF